MRTAAKELFVNAFYCASPSQSWTGLWAHPRSTGLRYNEIGFWTDLARSCEDGLLDGIFLADTLGVSDVYQGSAAAILRAGGFVPSMDPMLVIPLMAAATRQLTFGITGNISYETPYLLARRLSTLDHLSCGRVAWNVVTGVLESTSRAVGLTAMRAHDERYKVADEYIALMYKLWEKSWDDDAAVRDPVRRVFTEPSRVRAIDHDGEYFRCKGIHLSEPSPQRTPVIFSAGASASGVEFIAKHAECAFISGGDKRFVANVVQQIRRKAVAYGRLPTDIKIFLGATIVTGRTNAEARDRLHEYGAYCDGQGNLAFHSGNMGLDFSKFALDDPIPKVKTNASQTKIDAMTAEPDRVLRVGDLAKFAPIVGRDTFMVGSAVEICDEILDWVRETDIDGLNLLRTVEPESLKSFCDLVIPELQNRGAFKEKYRDGPLREKLFPGSNGRLGERHPAKKPD
ncbi:MAG: NtaA/DmoA family FMN-dependent monooxygenase [Reyranellaceae bacterium]